MVSQETETDTESSQSDNINNIINSNNFSDSNKDKSLKYCIVKKEYLYWLAALVWYIGVIACGNTGYLLLLDAQNTYNNSDNEMYIMYLCWSFSIFIGLLLSYILFIPILKKNLIRILSLENPKIYEFFRIRFWFMLIFFDGGIFICTTYFAKDSLSHALIGALDFSVCISLGISGILYITEWKSFHEKCINLRDTGKDFIQNSNIIYSHKSPVFNDNNLEINNDDYISNSSVISNTL